MLHDPTLQRTSGCPVHFLWDGRGLGRFWVRAGFLGFVVAGVLGTGGAVLRNEGLRSSGLSLLGLSLLVWTVGQAITAYVGRHAR